MAEYFKLILHHKKNSYDTRSSVATENDSDHVDEDIDVRIHNRESVCQL